MEGEERGQLDSMRMRRNPIFSFPELRGSALGQAGPGCVSVSARERCPCCCLQCLRVGVQEGMLRPLAAPLCSHTLSDIPFE